MSAAVRPASADEIDATVRTLADAGFGASVGRLLAYPWEQPSGEVLVAAGRLRRIHGAVCCASFGTTGWIGALGVAPRHRGRGVGTALMEAAVGWLRSRGAQSVLLYATDAGRPIYERGGFSSLGRARAWRGPAAYHRSDSVRPLRESDRAATMLLDREATGERRDPVFDAIDPLRGYCVESAGSLRGYMLHSPWGAGPAVLAVDREAGLALLGTAMSASGSSVVTLPDANAAGIAAIRDLGFTVINHAERMCLGPAPGWRPQQIFGMFNLFWG